MHSWWGMGRWGMVALGLVMAGCYLSHGRSEEREDRRRPRFDAGWDASFDAGREHPRGRFDAANPRPRGRDDAGIAEPVECEDPQGVDLLVVFDDSGSLRRREGLVRDRVERLVSRLVRPLDIDGDGLEDWPRIGDLHLGVVNTSVIGPDACAGADDGQLRRGTPASYEHCTEASYGPILRYEHGDDADRLVDDFTCLAFGPRRGCQVEQPLEAMAKALLPRHAPMSFPYGGPHGDLENAGFLRDESVLVVLIITDEPDQSVRDAEYFRPQDAGWPDGDAGDWDAGWHPARPFRDFAHPPQRYVDALRWLRPGHPERIVFAAIAGIRQPLVTDVRTIERSSCAGGFPERIVEVAEGLPERSVLGSVCDLSEMEAVQAIAQRIGDAACPD